MKKITIMSRTQAIKYCHQPHDRQSVMIAIATPLTQYNSAPFVSVRNKIQNILRLEFEDASEGDGIMTERDAKAVADFVRKYAGTEHIIVHCDAGRSRSAGVAAAIMKYENGDDFVIFNDPGYEPNGHCYRMTLSAFGF